jgi:ABC-type transporter Mla MlaB component/CheY-like chemotaxis protein
MQVEPLSRQCGTVVLELANVSFIDSAGVGALVRLLGLLRSHGCELSLCQLAPCVERVLQITHLLDVIPTHVSEQEAIRGSQHTSQSEGHASAPAKTKIVCTDGSREVLAYLTTLLECAGYQVLTARHPSDALTLVKVTNAALLICGPGLQTNQLEIEKSRSGVPVVRLLHLPSDFSTADAGEGVRHAAARVVVEVDPDDHVVACEPDRDDRSGVGALHLLRHPTPPSRRKP